MKGEVNLYTFSGLYFYSDAMLNQSFTCWEEVKLIEHSSIVDVKAEMSNQVWWKRRISSSIWKTVNSWLKDILPEKSDKNF